MNPTPRNKLPQREDEQFRSQLRALLEEPDHWQDYQHIRDWIEKLLRRDPDRAYTRAQREAVGRIIATRTPSWVGAGSASQN